MKLIEFIAPVEAMRGNLSGTQKLQYPTDNQGAYEGPVGSVNYARNYSPRFIGAKIAKSGKKYFAVKTKSANHLTAKGKHAMAVMGGTGALIGLILRDKTQERYQNLYNAWLKAVEMGDSRTFRKFLDDNIRPMIENRQASVRVQVGAFGETIYNPWIGSGTTYTLPNKIVLKFWSELGPVGAITYELPLPDGTTALAPWISGKTFAQISENGFANGLYSSLGITVGAMIASGSDQVKFRIGEDLNPSGTLYVVDGESETPVLANASFDASSVYIVKSNA